MKVQYQPTILIATGTMNAGGTETLIMEMLRHQTRYVRYILMIHYQGEMRKGVYDDEIRDLGIEMVYIPSIGSLGVLGYCKKFREVVSGLGRIDIVHSHLNANGGIISLAAQQAGIKHRISHCHADIRFRGSWLSNVKDEFALQVLRLYVNFFSTNYWACSHAAWRRLFYPWKKEVVIPNMINVKQYLSSLEEKEEAKGTIGLKGKFVVGSVGRVVRIKNYELAIETIALLNQQGHETHFVCFGRFDAEKDAYCAELVALAKALNVTEKIHFMGNTTDVPHNIKAFDVFLMPSTTEGFGMAAIEAQAAGIPTLLSDGIPHIVDVEAGLVTFLPIKNAQSWADTILSAKDCKRPDNHTILECFNKKGYNSVTMVREIENKYVEICQ